MSEKDDKEPEIIESTEVKKSLKQGASKTFIIIALIVFTILNIAIVLGKDALTDVLMKNFDSITSQVEDDADKEDFSFDDLRPVLSDLSNTEYLEKDKFGIVNMVKNVGNSIVSVSSTTTVVDWFDRQYQSEGEGSGIIFNITNDKVMIVTNNHVIENASAINVTLLGQEVVSAEVIGRDPETDIAVISIDIKDIEKETFDKLQIARFGDSDELEVGEIAVAIGNPLGKGYTNTVTMGIISGLDRTLVVSRRNYTLIQADAAISPGNSGGGLFNYKGEVVGINSVKIASTDVEGIGFAIPSNKVKPIVEELVNNGNIKRPYIGITGRDIGDDLADLYEIPVGVYVQSVVQGSGAESSGIKKTDIIIEANGTKVSTVDELNNIINSYKVGDTVELKIIRNMKDKINVRVVLQDKNS